MGIKFIEKGILDTLSKMGVDEIDTTGKFNPELHQAIDTENDENFETGDIIKVATKVTAMPEIIGNHGILFSSSVSAKSSTYFVGSSSTK